LILTAHMELSASHDPEARARESLRAAYRPQKVRMLLIGESPPASGRFFYNRDSGLYRALRDTFRLVDPSLADQNFLAVFQRTGCYLVDACHQPADRMETGARRAACSAGESLLSRDIQSLRPEIIVTLLRSIAANVRRAATHAGWTGTMIEVPYPGRWIQHRKLFHESLVPHLNRLMKEDTIA
jgi:hypothetical protein